MNTADDYLCLHGADILDQFDQANVPWMEERVGHCSLSPLCRGAATEHLKCGWCP